MRERGVQAIRDSARDGLTACAVSSPAIASYAACSSKAAKAAHGEANACAYIAVFAKAEASASTDASPGIAACPTYSANAA